MNLRGPLRKRVLGVLGHVALLLATLITATMAGIGWSNKDPFELAYLPIGLTYAILVLLVLGIHEMGHYVAARLNGLDSTLPYFIPFPSVLGLFPFGTLGAVIRLRSPINSRNSLVDVGASGPIAGFIASTVVLAIGFATLPSKEFLYSIHPEYAGMQDIPVAGLTFGSCIWFSIIGRIFAPTGAFVPPMNEVYHYPFLCVGWLGLLVTAMNLIPIGQLDGGHIARALLGHRARGIAILSLVILIGLGCLGIWESLFEPVQHGWPGWLLWAIVLLLFTRGLKSSAVELPKEPRLTLSRQWASVACAIILVVSFSPTPISIR